MMYFLFGVCIGLLLAVLVGVVLLLFRAPIERQVPIVRTALGAVGPHPKGFIIEPPDQAEEAREKIISRNRKQGKDTPIKDLV